jgi:hypothetical protein
VVRDGQKKPDVKRATSNFRGGFREFLNNFAQNNGKNQSTKEKSKNEEKNYPNMVVGPELEAKKEQEMIAGKRESPKTGEQMAKFSEKHEKRSIDLDLDDMNKIHTEYLKQIDDDFNRIQEYVRCINDVTKKSGVDGKFILDLLRIRGECIKLLCSINSERGKFTYNFHTYRSKHEKLLSVINEKHARYTELLDEYTAKAKSELETVPVARTPGTNYDVPGTSEHEKQSRRSTRDDSDRKWLDKLSERDVKVQPSDEWQFKISK